MATFTAFMDQKLTSNLSTTFDVKKGEGGESKC